MKNLLIFLIKVIITGIGVGFYFKKNTGNYYGEITIGLSVLTLAFLFIYHGTRIRNLMILDL